MKKLIITLLLTCALAVPAFAGEYDFTAEDPRVLSQIPLKGMTRKELRKAFRALLGTYTELYNTYYEIEPETETASGEVSDASATAEVYTTTVNLNIRKEPSTDSEILGRFDTGAVVDVVSVSDGWAQIRYQGETAYVSAQYIAQTTVPAGQAAQAAESGSAVPCSNSDFTGCYCWDVTDTLKHAGFTNIEETEEETVLTEDLPFGLLTETGDVKEVLIDGNTDYEKGARFAADVKITVVSFRIIDAPEESEGGETAPAPEESPVPESMTDEETEAAEALTEAVSEP